MTEKCLDLSNLLTIFALRNDENNEDNDEKKSVFDGDFTPSGVVFCRMCHE